MKLQIIIIEEKEEGKKIFRKKGQRGEKHEMKKLVRGEVEGGGHWTILSRLSRIILDLDLYRLCPFPPPHFLLSSPYFTFSLERAS